MCAEIDDLDKVAFKRGREKTVPKDQPLVRGFARRVSKGTEDRRARLPKKEALEFNWIWMKGVCKLGAGATVSG